MKIKFEFEIDGASTEEIDPADLVHFDELGEVEQQLTEWADDVVCWRVFIDPEDLSALWKEIKKIKREAA